MSDNGHRGTSAPWAPARRVIGSLGTISGHGNADPDAPRRRIPLDLDLLAVYNAGIERAVEANRVQPERERHLEGIGRHRRT